jgi:YggT family protein
MLLAIDRFIYLLTNLLVLLIFVNTILSFFLSPYHPVRSTLDRIIGPLLAPIRRVIPPVGMFDLSPLFLILIVEVLSYVLRTILSSL